VTALLELRDALTGKSLGLSRHLTSITFWTGSDHKTFCNSMRNSFSEMWPLEYSDRDSSIAKVKLRVFESFERRTSHVFSTIQSSNESRSTSRFRYFAKYSEI
jgi:hypothetical protein